MDKSLAVPHVVTIDDMDEPADIIDSMCLAGFLLGSEPFALTARLQRVRPDAPLMPPDADVARKTCGKGKRSQLVSGEGWTLRAVRWQDGSADVTVTASREELARDVLRAATTDAIEPTPPLDEATSIGFWHLTTHGSVRVVRSIATTPWPQIRPNYTVGVARAIDRLMDFTPERLTGGRLLLFHGPPGTGKTTVLRALSHAWWPWCKVEYVLDPERLLQDPGYLMEAVLGEDDSDDDPADDCAGTSVAENPRKRRWRMLVLEDCDELIRADAKEASGQALARLLNLTDGLVGQGLDVLVCITTNEELVKLHPAIIRPGRCLSHIHIGPLSADEAMAWLGEGDYHVTAAGATLAELFAMRGDIDQVERPEELRPSSQYL